MNARRMIAVEDADPIRRARLLRLLLVSGFTAAVDPPVCPVLVVLPSSPELRSRLAAIAARWPGCRRIVLLSQGETVPAGLDAEGVITDGFNPAKLAPALSAALAPAVVRTPSAGTGTASEIIGESNVIRRLRKDIAEIAAGNVTALLIGETGSGKECAARMLHRLSRRATGPLVAVNCAAVPDGLLEGELFGFERGAFTGAVRAFPGKFKLADHGTMFLDEIGDLSATAQAKILRAIETREIQRLGGLRPEPFDARFIAATNVNLEARMHEGLFRADLYYRIAVAVLELPPLRSRREDVPLLAQHALIRLDGGRDRRFTDAALESLCAHDWPGNVRELINVVEVANLRCHGDVITPEHLPMRRLPSFAPALMPLRAAGRAMDEKALILRTLAEDGGNKTRAARSLSWSRMTLYRKLAQHGIGHDR